MAGAGVGARFGFAVGGFGGSAGTGGVDSALVAAIATDAFGSEKVQAIMLPSPFTGQESLNDAKDAADLLKIKFSQKKKFLTVKREKIQVLFMQKDLPQKKHLVKL